MKTKSHLLIKLSLIVLIQLMLGLPAGSQPLIACGQTITQDTTLSEDLVCPAGDGAAIMIGASNLTLDLGGHLLQGNGLSTGVLAVGYESVTIRNGTIDGFIDGIFLIETRYATVEHLTLRNMTSSDPADLILGVKILDSQDVVVRDMLFEFPSVAHKEAVEIYSSAVSVNNIEVRGGGAGVNFSFAGACDPLNKPNTGEVLNSRFYEIYIAGIEIACTSSARIAGNEFTAPPEAGIGIQGDAPFPGAVTGVVIERNWIHDTAIGIEFRGILDSSISNNHIRDNSIWGIAMRQSLGCIAPQPGWECFYSTGNTITGNLAIENGMDLYHFDESTGNTWGQNICETRQGVEIPECLQPVFLYLPLFQ
jgi:hypothetical protein